jgi:hypothetical protein
MAPDIDELTRWAGRPGSARHDLLAPLTEHLARPVMPPPEIAQALGGLIKVLDEARLGLPLEPTRMLDLDFAATFNEDLGFDTPWFLNGDRTFLEVDALHMICIRLGLVSPRRGLDRLTPLGERLAGRPDDLWRAVARALGELPSPLGDVAELILSAMLRQAERDPEEALCLARSALIEAAGWHRAISPADPDYVLDVVAVASASLQTALRALRLIEPWSDMPDGVLVLNEQGRATVTAALKARVRTGRRATELSRLTVGRWN